MIQHKYFMNIQNIIARSENWFLTKFKSDMWSKYLQGGNKYRKLDISCILPETMFNKYIYQFNGKRYGRSVLHFAGGTQRLSTKYKNGKCPYLFLSWFFNDAQTLKCIAKRKPDQWINIYNYNMSYCKKSNKLRFTCDITWKYIMSLENDTNVQPVWQKLNDTT